MKLTSLFCLTLVFMCTVDGPEERESESPLQSGVVSIPVGMISSKPILNTRFSGSSSESHPQRWHTWPVEMLRRIPGSKFLLLFICLVAICITIAWLYDTSHAFIIDGGGAQTFSPMISAL